MKDLFFAVKNTMMLIFNFFSTYRELSLFNAVIFSCLIFLKGSFYFCILNK